MKCMWYCRLEHAIDMAVTRMPVTRVCIPLLCDDVSAGRCKHKRTPKPAHEFRLLHQFGVIVSNSGFGSAAHTKGSHGTLPSSANQCILGNVYLRSNLSRKGLAGDNLLFKVTPTASHCYAVLRFPRNRIVATIPIPVRGRMLAHIFP